MRFSDEPIVNYREDILGRGKFVRELSKQIQNRKTNAPLVIGINGKWGDGKSSLLNLLKAELQGKIEVITFDPWYFRSQDELLKLFFRTLFSSSEKRAGFFQRIRIRRTIRRLVSKLSSLPLSLSYQGLGIKMADLLGTRSPEEEKKELALLLNAIDKKRGKPVKRLILIDNLDRLQSDELILILKLIRLCGDFRNFTYILAFDYEYVVELLNRQFEFGNLSGAGEDYLKKIVQFDFKLPEIDGSKLDRFLNENFELVQKELEIELDDEFTQRFSRFYQSNVKKKIIRNLRDAKIFLNSIFVTLSLMKDEVDYGDWIILEMVRVFSPRAYGFIRTNIDDFSPSSSDIAGYQDLPAIKAEMQKTRKRLKKGLADRTGENSLDFVYAAVDFLFPVYAGLSDELFSPPLPSSYDYGEYFRKQRIASHDYRNTYFQLYPEEGQISDAEVKQILIDLNALSSQEFSTILDEKLSEYKSSGVLKNFFDKLIFRVDLIAESRRNDWANTLVKNANLYSKKIDLFLSSEEERAQAVIMGIINTIDDKEQVTALFEEMILNSASVSFAVDLAFFSRAERNRIQRDFAKLDFPRINEILKTNLRRLYLENQEDIFLLERSDYSFILFQWAGPLLEDKAKVQQYLDAIFTSNPSRAAKFVEIFVRTNALDENDWHLELEQLETTFDREWIKKHLQKIAGDQSLSEREKFAVGKILATS